MTRGAWLYLILFAAGISTVGLLLWGERRRCWFAQVTHEELP